eukprot:CAMPEP_0119316846 /NCGR_PEP_ID=MMETSP1333-20130426/41093_1 /TAXON_ID=418940 /ORGANISM="Scyphosphaera apsteinii, Strain RCC1455" /LENGTH=352 /DNA_ID=CAMNT_0007322607 /DNA_START=179 /DNA_END=1237 /DNA_ORIENTATION=-
MNEFMAIRDEAYQITLDSVMGGASKGTAYGITLDSVMRGDSTGNATSAVGQGIVLQGNIDMDGGGFVSMSLIGDYDFTDASGLMFEVQSVKSDAPLALAVAFSQTLQNWGPTSVCSRLEGAVGLPAGTGTHSNYVYLDVKAMGRQRSIFTSFIPWPGFGLPCAPYDFSRLKEIAIRNVYQEGPFKIVIRSIKAVQKPPAWAEYPIKDPPPVTTLPETDITEVAASFVAAALYKGSVLQAKRDSNWDYMASRIYQTAALQVNATEGAVDESIREALLIAALQEPQAAQPSANADMATSLRDALYAANPDAPAAKEPESILALILFIIRSQWAFFICWVRNGFTLTDECGTRRQ